MGYGIQPYAVRLSKLRAAYGSHDEALLARIERDLADAIREHDEAFRDAIERGAPPVELALRRLLEGATRGRRHGFMYVHALELLCSELGRPMAGPPLDRVSSAFLDQVDSALARGGVRSLRMADLLEGRAPVPLPRASSPSVATLEPPQVRRALAEIRRVDAATEPTEVADAIAQIAEWLAAAAAGRGLGIVSFLG